MRTRLVGPEHPITKGELEGDAEEFFQGVLPSGGAEGAVLAQHGGETVGWLRFYWDEPSRTMTASGTWVEEEHRSAGVAQVLWGRVMKHLKPRTVVVTTVTKEGRHLVGSIVRWFPKTDFNVKAGI